jgi:Mg2+-importing ATPase
LIRNKAHVIRDGQEVLIESREVVPGDLVIIEAGDIVPADLRLIETTRCSIDESMLTGESVQVEKRVETSDAQTIFKAQNVAFSGTQVLSGRAKGICFATGKNSEVGSIAHLTDQSKRVSGFEKSIAAYSQVILKIIFFTLLVVMGLNIIIKYDHIDFYSLLFFSIALAISVIPEGLPVVTTLALSQGAMMLTKLKVVVKRLSAIEDLGSIEILCADKTGTLTQNVMSVSDMFLCSGTRSELILTAAQGASFLAKKKKEPNNSFDIAIWNKLSEAERKKAETTNFQLIMPFEPDRKRSTAVLKKDHSYEIIVRGIPELIIQHSLMSAAEKKSAGDWARQKGEEGMRVLAVCIKNVQTAPSEINDSDDITRNRCVGLIAFEDPLKKSSSSALKKAEKLGVQVKILTGDSKEVSIHVAKKVGLIKSVSEAITGEEFDRLSNREQYRAVYSHHVFARVTPEQKHTIINSFS